MSEEISSEQLEAITGDWGDEYLPADENPVTSQVELPNLNKDSVAKVAGQEEEGPNLDQQATPPAEQQKQEEPAAEEAQEAAPPAEKQKQEEEKAPEPEADKETARRLAMLERREIQLRQREQQAKTGIEEQIAKLEQMQSQLEQDYKARQELAEKEKAQFQQDPSKLLDMVSQRYGLNFQALAAANLRRSGVEVPPELEAQIPKHDPISGLEERLAKLVEGAVSPLAQKLEAQERAAQEAATQQQQSVVDDNKQRAVGFVHQNSQQFPYLSAAFQDEPEVLAEQMLAARDEIYRATGNYGKISDAAGYIENKLAAKFHHLAAPRTGQPASTPPRPDSEKPSSPAAVANETSTLSNEAGADRVSRTPISMEEEYELAWEKAPGFLRGT